MRIHMAANYEGFELGRELESWVLGLGHEVVWHGAEAYDFEDDYPLFAFRIGQAVIADEDQALEVRGVLIGGIGGGETIAANKVPGARAVFGHSVDFVTKSREHANASILVIGALNTKLEQAKAMITAIIEASFNNVLDDARRIVNTNEYEASKTIEGWTITN